MYRFNGSVWIEQAKLSASDAARGDSFGLSVSVSEETAVVGAPDDACAAGDDCGEAYIFVIAGFSDCNANGIADECDIEDGSSTDANTNGIPDECDTNLPPFIIEHPTDVTACGPETVVFAVESGGMPSFSYQWCKDTVDLDGETTDTLTLSGVSVVEAGDYDVVVTNTLGSVISDAATLAIVSAAQLEIAPDPGGIRKNRYLSLIPSPVPCMAAIRVPLLSLQHPVPPNDPPYPPPNYSAYEFGPGCTDPGGCVRWVGAPGMHLEVQDIPTFGTFQAASLQCTPHYQDWSDVGLFSVTGAEIIPSSLYEVEVVSVACAGNEDTCKNVSPPLQIPTARWGDIAERRNPPSNASQPDAIDIVWLVNKYMAFEGALSNTVVQLQPNVPNINADVNALDISLCVNVFKGYAYPFSGPCPCLSLATCGALPCSASSTCTGSNLPGLGAGALCVKTCVGGANDGDSCIKNTHCPGSICGAGFCRDRCARCTP